MPMRPAGEPVRSPCSRGWCHSFGVKALAGGRDREKEADGPDLFSGVGGHTFAAIAGRAPLEEILHACGVGEVVVAIEAKVAASLIKVHGELQGLPCSDSAAEAWVGEFVAEEPSAQIDRGCPKVRHLNIA